MPRIKKTYNKRTYKRNFSTGYGFKPKRKKSGNGIFKLFFSFVFKTLRPVLVLTVIFVALFYTYKFTISKIYASDMLMIENIEVTGCNNVTATEIQKLMPFKIGDNLLKIDLSRAQKDIQKYKPELKTISMTRNWKNKTVSIELMERQPEAFIYENKDLVGLDFDNAPFRLIGNMVNSNVPVLIYNTVEERDELLDFIKISKPYFNDFMCNIKEIKFGEIQSDIVFVTNSGTKIYFGKAKKSEIESKIKKMKKVLKDSVNKFGDIEYIDLTYLDMSNNTKSKNNVLIKPLIKDNQQKKEV